MNTIEINSIKYTMPESWDEVTLDQFSRIQGLSNEVGSKKVIGILSILSCIPSELISQLSGEHLLTFTKLIEWANSEPSGDYKDNFEFKGKKYIVYGNYEKWSFGQYVDFDYLNKDGDIWNNAHKIFAVFAIEEGEEYNTDKMLIRAEEFKQLPITLVISCLGFFLNKRNLSMGVSALSSLVEEYRGQLVQHIENSLKTGGGMSLLTNWRKTISLCKTLYWLKKL